MWVKFLTLLAKVRWEWLIKIFKKPSRMNSKEERELKRYLKDDYYIIATYDPYALSGLFVILSSWLLTFRFPKYTHVLFNVENDSDTDSNGIQEFKFVEATSKGVHVSNFASALGKSKRIALITPKYYSQNLFNDSVSKVYKYLGRAYDFSYNIKADDKLSCVELVWNVLKELPEAEKNFICTRKLIEQEGNLIPQMFLCEDYQVIKEWEYGR